MPVSNAEIAGIFTQVADLLEIQGENPFREDGRLDLPDAVLAELDVVVAAVHSEFNLPQGKQTERIVRALDHPLVRILAHPSGRLINERDAYEVDLERVIAAAGERGRILELDAHPQRLDLEDVHRLLARERGLKVAISTGAHAAEHLDFMRYGVGQARRGWLEASDVVNTLGLPALRRLLKHD